MVTSGEPRLSFPLSPSFQALWAGQVGCGQHEDFRTVQRMLIAAACTKHRLPHNGHALKLDNPLKSLLTYLLNLFIYFLSCPVFIPKELPLVSSQPLLRWQMHLFTQREAC